jgi:hypothetical protein
MALTHRMMTASSTTCASDSWSCVTSDRRTVVDRATLVACPVAWSWQPPHWWPACTLIPCTTYTPTCFPGPGQPGAPGSVKSYAVHATVTALVRSAAASVVHAKPKRRIGHCQISKSVSTMYSNDQSTHGHVDDTAHTPDRRYCACNAHAHARANKRHFNRQPAATE